MTIDKAILEKNEVPEELYVELEQFLIDGGREAALKALLNNGGEMPQRLKSYEKEALAYLEKNNRAGFLAKQITHISEPVFEKPVSGLLSKSKFSVFFHQNKQEEVAEEKNKLKQTSTIKPPRAS